MDIGKLAPWNWFKKEEDNAGATMPIRREDATPAHSGSLPGTWEEMDRMLDDFFRGFGLPPMRRAGRSPEPSRATWLKPTLDVGATEKEYSVTVELPGVDRKDVSVELVGDTLRIKGEKKQEEEEKRRNYYRVERSYGSFQRTLCVPEDVDPEGLKASFKNGLLRIAMPRKAVADSKARRITVNAA